MHMVGEKWAIANARIWTGDDDCPWSDGMQIVDGMISQLGAEDHSSKFDLRGGFVTPGLIDAHLHFLAGGESLQILDLSDASTPAEFMQRIRAEHDRLPSDRWLIATGWSENRWDPPVVPDLSWLSGCEDRPVVCWRMDLHSALVNTVVLDMLELPDDEVLQSQGGRLVRDKEGQPTGILQEAAAWQYLNPLIPKLPDSVRASAIEKASLHCLSLGVTSVRTMEYKKDLLGLFLKTHCANPSIRMSAVVLDRVLPLDMEWIDKMPHDDWFRITGCKSFLDGTLGSRTARLLEPYNDEPQNYGSYTEHLLDGKLSDWVDQVVSLGFSPVMHAIGDAAVMEAILAVADLPVDCRATIEHAEVVTPRVLEMLRDNRHLRLSVQPLHRADDAVYAEVALGGERAGCLLPMASIAEMGIPLAFGSDWPVVSVDPILGMAAAITGLDIDGKPFHQDEAITIDDALKGYTVHAADAAGLDHVGVLQPGRKADFVIWDRNPFDIDWTSERPVIRATIVDGRLVYGNLPTQEQQA